VAMGRAIVRSPRAFLMDEPLSNLDAKLRVQTRAQVAQLQTRLGTTMVYVTHDQTEAMTLGDRIAVMRAGVLQQVGTPAELYDNPSNLFVAGFIGSPAMNFMPARVDGDVVKLPMVDAPLPRDALERIGDAGHNLIAGIRPEAFEDAALVGEKIHEGVTFRSKVDLVESLGSELYVHFSLEHEGVQSQELEELAQDAGTTDVPGSGAAVVVARFDAASDVKEGQEQEFWLDTSKLYFFKEDGSAAVTAAHLTAARS
jgi:multiple sugar transport system ATP-binding protein